jgi:predicted lipid-binding transport protein (Tim44 family)
MGPIAGLAAGLGIAALASHLGFGEELANFLTIALLAMAAIFVVRWLMRRFAGQGAAAAPRGMQFAGMPGGSVPPMQAPVMPAGGSSAAAAAVPAGFDAAGFERIAKMIFIRLQAANDSGDLNDLRAFTTPEMFAAIRLDLQDRQGSAQQTDVVQIDAEVLDVAEEAQRQIVSVRFHGLIREQRDDAAAPFDEVWHLVRPRDGSREWAIAGIQQSQTA